MSRRVKVRWTVTETHEAVIEIPDGVDEVDDELLAEHEDARSWCSTDDRDVLEHEEVE